jgi:hypothetical protein
MPGLIRISCISVIAPMLNEAPYVEQLATDLAKQDFAGEVEILVADSTMCRDLRGNGRGQCRRLRRTDRQRTNSNRARCGSRDGQSLRWNRVVT